ncbi:MAG: hypothetical protein ACI828_002448, partial [Flavobacteriales bacterium]
MFLPYTQYYGLFFQSFIPYVLCVYGMAYLYLDVLLVLFSGV